MVISNNFVVATNLQWMQIKVSASKYISISANRDGTYSFGYTGEPYIRSLSEIDVYREASKFCDVPSTIKAQASALGHIAIARRAEILLNDPAELEYRWEHAKQQLITINYAFRREFGVDIPKKAPEPMRQRRHLTISPYKMKFKYHGVATTYLVITALPSPFAENTWAIRVQAEVNSLEQAMDNQVRIRSVLDDLARNHGIQVDNDIFQGNYLASI